MKGIHVLYVLPQIILCSILILIIIEYGLDLKKPYPQWAIEIFDEPLVRFVSYVSIYTLTCWSPMLSILTAITIVFLHLDYINLVKQQHTSL